jgi:hypothetical protein
MTTLAYTPNLARGVRMRLVDDNHPKSGQCCTVIGALPNPSQRSEHQWYDVQFDDSSIGRFLEKQLQRAEGATS